MATRTPIELVTALARVVTTPIASKAIAKFLAVTGRETARPWMSTSSTDEGDAPSVFATTPSGSAESVTFGLTTRRSQTRSEGPSTLIASEPDIERGLDPRLQLTVARQGAAMPLVSTVSAAADEVSVVALVSDVDAWEAMSEVRVGSRIGKNISDLTLVTARIPVARIEAVRRHSCVQSLKAAHSIRPVLSATTDETSSTTSRLPFGAQPDGARGVVVGIIDFGCDFAHQNFRDSNGQTRIETIWHQAGQGQGIPGFTYGRVIRAPEINQALKQSDPYAALRYGPEPDSPNQIGTHGTHVMDIAAGNGRGSRVAGCAPSATLVFVDLSATDIPWQGSKVVDYSFGDSVRLLEAIIFVFEQAGDRPCVVNLSLGTNGGPHDGTTLVEQGIDAQVRSKPNRAVVIAASNSHDHGIHAMGTIPSGGSVDVEWRHAVSRQPAELEVWLPGLSNTAVQLITPNGIALETVESNDNRSWLDNGQIGVYIANRRKDPNNGANQIGIYISDEFLAGTWTVRLHERGPVPVDFHAWIERFDHAQSKFVTGRADTHTLGSISCGLDSIVVGSYDAHKAARPISWFSSEGPTRDGREKPEISAPGHDVLAAHSRTGTMAVRKSGTSMAAPAVAGIIALLFAEARRGNSNVSSAQLRSMLLACGSRNPPQSPPKWDSRYGFGRIAADSLIKALTAV